MRAKLGSMTCQNRASGRGCGSLFIAEKEFEFFNTHAGTRIVVGKLGVLVKQTADLVLGELDAVILEINLMTKRLDGAVEPLDSGILRTTGGERRFVGARGPVTESAVAVSKEGGLERRIDRNVRRCKSMIRHLLSNSG